MKNKKLLFLIAVLILTFVCASLTACNNTSDGAKPADKEEPGTITPPPTTVSDSTVNLTAEQIDAFIEKLTLGNGSFEVAVTMRESEDEEISMTWTYNASETSPKFSSEESYGGPSYVEIYGKSGNDFYSFSKGYGDKKYEAKKLIAIQLEAELNDIKDEVLGFLDDLVENEDNKVRVISMFGESKYAYTRTGVTVTKDGKVTTTLTVKTVLANDSKYSDDAFSLTNSEFEIVFAGDTLSSIKIKEKLDETTVAPTERVSIKEMISEATVKFTDVKTIEIPSLTDCVDKSPTTTNVNILGADRQNYQTINDLTCGATVNLPAYPTLNDDALTAVGYYYDEYFTKSAGIAGASIVIPYDDDEVNLFLKTEYEDSFTVSFDVDGGSPVAAVEQKANVDLRNVVYKFERPEKVGYIFEDWYSDAAKTNSVQDSREAIILANDVTLYAKFVKCPIVTLVANGIDYTLPKIIVDDNYSIKLPVPEKAGKTFVGWYTDEACTEANAVMSREENYYQSPAEDDVYYAKFIDAWVITLNKNGKEFVAPASINAPKLGANDNAEEAFENLTEALEDLAENINIAGFGFVGWSTSATENVPLEAYPTANVTLYATFVVANVITFDSTNAQIVSIYQGKTDAFWKSTIGVTEFSDFYNAILNAAKEVFTVPEGKVVEGFYTDSACTQKFNAWPSSAITVYTKLTDVVGLTFDVKGGALPTYADSTEDIGMLKIAADSEEMTYFEMIASIGEDITAPEGKEFVCWCTDTALTTPITEDAAWPTAATTIYAKYRDIVKITFVLEDDVNTNSERVFTVKDINQGIDEERYGDYADFLDRYADGLYYTGNGEKEFAGFYKESTFTTAASTTLPTESITIYVKFIAPKTISISYDMEAMDYYGMNPLNLRDVASSGFTSLVEQIVGNISVKGEKTFDGLYTDSTFETAFTAMPTDTVTVYVKVIDIPEIIVNLGAGYVMEWDEEQQESNPSYSITLKPVFYSAMDTYFDAIMIALKQQGITYPEGTSMIANIYTDAAKETPLGENKVAAAATVYLTYKQAVKYTFNFTDAVYYLDGEDQITSVTLDETEISSFQQAIDRISNFDYEFVYNGTLNAVGGIYTDVACTTEVDYEAELPEENTAYYVKFVRAPVVTVRVGDETNPDSPYYSGEWLEEEQTNEKLYEISLIWDTHSSMSLLDFLQQKASNIQNGGKNYTFKIGETTIDNNMPAPMGDITVDVVFA